MKVSGKKSSYILKLRSMLSEDETGLTFSKSKPNRHQFKTHSLKPRQNSLLRRTHKTFGKMQTLVCTGHVAVHWFATSGSYWAQGTVPLMHAQNNLPVVTYLIYLGAKIKPKSYKNQRSDNLESEKYLSAFELSLKFVTSSISPSTGYAPSMLCKTWCPALGWFPCTSSQCSVSPRTRISNSKTQSFLLAGASPFPSPAMKG